MARDRYPVHGRRRRLRVLWTVGCRCGMDAYPCIVEQMLNSSVTDDTLTDGEIYTAGLSYARWWRDQERRHWSRGTW